MTNGIPDIWDMYVQNQQTGWSPPPGIEGYRDNNVVTTSGINWTPPGSPKPNQPEPPSPLPQNPIPQNPVPQGGNMPIFGQNYDDIRRRNQGFFPNVNPGAGNQQFPVAPGVAAGQARMNELAKTGTYQSRRDDFRNKYPQFVNPSAQQNLQNFNVAQAYNTGYGTPNPTTQQGPGGPYQVAGGVMKPIQTSLFPNIFATPAASAIGNFAGGNIQGAFTGMRNAINQANSFFSGNRQPQPPYGGGYAAGPRRYFDY